MRDLEDTYVAEEEEGGEIVACVRIVLKEEVAVVGPLAVSPEKKVSLCREIVREIGVSQYHIVYTM